jgi:CheY-like chemotaxis protein/anti-sigma regulatory factor (Ser/Thr protein kinase)
MSKSLILAVDDEALNLEILLEYFEGEDSLALHTANGGEAAWQMLQNPETRYHAILLDRMMPGLDGVGLLKRIKAAPSLAGIPVIMQTAANSAAQIREGLEAGAYYYLTPPYKRDNLLAIVHAALMDGATRDLLRQQLHSHLNALQFLTNASFSISCVDEASQLASFIAQACPNSDNVVMGISELLVNAVEHGNLGLTYSEKSSLKQNDTWRSEVDRRMALPENRAKFVRLDYLREPDLITLKITDQGSGFDWQKYLEIDPERAFDPNGRGIALSRMLSFTDLTFQGCGNTAIATISTSQPNQT